jgi:hypothetical protein
MPPAAKARPVIEVAQEIARSASEPPKGTRLDRTTFESRHRALTARSRDCQTTPCRSAEPRLCLGWQACRSRIRGLSGLLQVRGGFLRATEPVSLLAPLENARSLQKTPRSQPTLA